MGFLQRVKGLAAADAVPSTDRHVGHGSTTTPSISSPTTTPEPVPLQVTPLIGGDKIIGPNVPVADLVASQPPAPSEKNVPSASGSHGDRNKELELELELKGGDPGEKGVVEASNEEKKDEDETEDESVYPGGAALAILTFGLCMATFVVALDNTIIGIPP